MKPLVYSLLFITSVCFAEDDLGWQVGLGVVSSDLLTEDADRPIFPAVRDDNKQYMLIPNLKWQGEHWSVGAEGIGWRTRFENDLKLQSTVGYPSSRISLSGERGWLRYGGFLSASYSDGTTTTAGVNAAGLSYELTTGYNDRADDRKHKVSFGAPVFISQSRSTVVIGTAYVQSENAPFIENNNDLTTSVQPGDYRHAGITLFSPLSLSDSLRLILSGTVQWNDQDLVQQLPLMPDVQFNTFALLSYQF
ncbi:hypothetical protein [Reinekea blandensis]|uniref:hypothetical protein n=1 Tax=Reinekea blandensis TaxID=374838 RepID=UPI0002E3DD78|nr:hypothetical protein [Reinekea blandensis]